MSVLPRLDYLVGLANAARYYTYRVFESDPGNGGIHEMAHEVERLFLHCLFLVKMSPSTCGEVGTGRMRDHHIPPVSEYVEDVPLVVVPVCGQEVTGRGVVSLGGECVAHYPGEFTGDKDFHLWAVGRLGRLFPNILERDLVAAGAFGVDLLLYGLHLVECGSTNRNRGFFEGPLVGRISGEGV